MTDSSVPVLSFPAILRNSGLTSRFAHLHEIPFSNKTSQQSTTQGRKSIREQNEGKRWIRRKDNGSNHSFYAHRLISSGSPASFVGNPHIVTATRRDYTLPVPQTQSTFPEPLPPYLPRTVKVPAATPSQTEPASANAGRFSVSLKGMRRDLRRAGGKAEALVRDVERVIVEWLTEGGTVIRPDHIDSGLHSDRKPVGLTGAIVEVSRTPLQLIWRISDDAFARYVVHCCARYHEVVSFSKSLCISSVELHS